MIQSSRPDPEQRPPAPDRKKRVLRRVGLSVGATVLLAGVAGSLGMRHWVYTRLVPLAEASLMRVVERPVQLGAVERFSGLGVEFGETVLPPTASDPDRAIIEAVRVTFNPLEMLFRRSLSLHVTLVEPTAFIEQEASGQWIATELQTLEPGAIEIKLDSIRLDDATVVLLPYQPPGEEGAETGDTQPLSSAQSGDRPPGTFNFNQPQGWPPLTGTTIVLQEVNGISRLRDDNQRILFDLTGQAASGGQFSAQGELNRTRRLQANAIIQTRQLNLNEFAPLLGELPVTLQSGRINSNLNASLQPNGRIDVQGTARFWDLGAQVRGLPGALERGSGQLLFEGLSVRLEDTTFRFGESVLQAKGRIYLQEVLQEGYDLVVQGDSIDLGNLLETMNVEVPIDLNGQVQAQVQIQGPLNQPILSGIVNEASPIQVDRVSLSSVGARFRVTPEALEVNAIEAVPAEGGLITGNGRVFFEPNTPLAFTLDVSDLPGDAIARSYLTDPLPASIRLGQVASTVNVIGSLQAPQVLALWQAPQATYPAQGELAWLGDRLSIRNAQLQIEGGTVTAEADANLTERQWEAIATLQNLPLSPLLPDQPGQVNGQVQLTGSLTNWNLDAIRGEGQLALTQAPVLGQPLTADVRWLGNGLEIRQASAPNLEASGFVATRIGPDGRPAIANLNLEVQAQDLDLEELTTMASVPLQVAGRADYEGQVTGTLESPSLYGDLGLRGLVVNEVAFDSPLQGGIWFTLGQGGRINLTGNQDRIALVIDDQYRPTEFFIQRDSSIAQGRTVGDRLQAQLENFPLAVLNLEPGAAFGLGEAGGWLTGNVSVDLSTFDPNNPGALQATGEVAIAQPSLGHIQGDRFAGRFVYQNGAAIVNGGSLVIGDSEYDVVGRLSPTSDTLFRGQITAESGNVQDLLVALKYFEISDLLRFLDPPQYGRADQVEPIPIRISETSLLGQLQRYSEIAELRDLQLAEQEAEFFPDLRELEGTFSGSIDVTVTRQEGLAAEFNLAGQNWRWGDYDPPNQMIAQGSFANNTLTLLPFRFESDDTLINFAGQIGQDENSTGQIRIEDVPTELVAQFLRLPIDLEGDLNATAAITGSVANIQARGEFNLADGSINQTPVQQASARFSYADARLNLIGGMQIADSDDPIRVTGSLPYKLPQGTVPPASDEISLDIQLEDDGLSILNVLTDQIAWGGGDASVRLQVGGTLRQTSNGIDLQPLATGFADLRGGTFSSRILPEPLTQVTGTIQFDRDRILVNQVQGQFSAGEVLAQGIIPLADPEALSESDTTTQPLTVALRDLRVNFKGLYAGDVDGQIRVGGSALAPQLGGEVLLSNGRVSLPDPTALGGAPAAQAAADPFSTLFTPPELNDLRVTLGDRLLITRAPILNFVATGGLVVDGPLNDFRNLRPDGTIRLRSGQVNVFTTQFNLDRGYENVAIFRPNEGTDPRLSLRLSTSVLEQTRSPIPSAEPFAQSEISDSSANDFAELQTVRIRATVDGPASSIFENLELSSSPGRTENEIVALIGGGFANTQGQGDGSLAIANLASTALFTSLQTLVSNAIGISDLRIFPTVITDDEREEGSSNSSPTSTFALAAELGVDITSNLSVSALQLLTVREPTQFSLRYRLNEQWLLRGSTNFSDDNRLVLEYEARF